MAEIVDLKEHLPLDLTHEDQPTGDVLALYGKDSFCMIVTSQAAVSSNSFGLLIRPVRL